MTDRDTTPAPASDLPTRALRALVPTSLALGIIALYPPISDRVVLRLGPGFRPSLVALYVATLVSLFLLDAWMRDRRLSKVRARASRAERRADLQNQRAEELRFVLDVASELNGRDRIESSLFRVLERLRTEIPFTTGHVFIRESDNGQLQRRGICPLTTVPSERSERLAHQTVDLEAYDNKNPVCLYGPAERPDAVGCVIRFQDQVIGVLVLEGVRARRETDQTRLLALADRLGASLNGMRVLATVEARERVLRHAYQELRLSGRRLARSTTLEEGAKIGRAAAEALREPLESALGELRRLKRLVAPEHRSEAFNSCADALRGQLERLGACRQELRDLGNRAGRPGEVAVNEALIAAVDLVLPDLKRSGIDLRLSLARDLPEIHMDEGILVHFLTRILRRERAFLRRAQLPRILMIETRPYGEGVKMLLRDNSAGLAREAPAGLLVPPASAAAHSPLHLALKQQERSDLGGNLDAHGISVELAPELGNGLTWIVCLRGVSAGSLL